MGCTNKKIIVTLVSVARRGPEEGCVKCEIIRHFPGLLRFQWIPSLAKARSRMTTMTWAHTPALDPTPWLADLICTFAPAPARAFERSCALCRFIQNSAVMSKYWPRRMAVSALMSRRARTISEMRFAGTPSAAAKARALSFRGFMNSSSNTSPGWVLILVISSPNDNPRFPHSQRRRSRQSKCAIANLSGCCARPRGHPSAPPDGFPAARPGR